MLAAGLATNELVVGDVAQGTVVVDTAVGWVLVGAIDWDVVVVVVLETATGWTAIGLTEVFVIVV